MRKIWEQYPREFYEWDEILIEHEPAAPVVALSYLREQCWDNKEVLKLYEDLENSFYNYADIFFKFNQILVSYNEEPDKYKVEYDKIDADRHNIH